MNNNYPFPPENYSESPEYIRRVVQSLRNCIRGKTNNTGEFNCEVSETATVITNLLCNVNSVITLTPVTQNAADHSDGTFVVAGDKSFTVYHQSKTHADRTFRYVIVG